MEAKLSTVQALTVVIALLLVSPLFASEQCTRGGDEMVGPEAMEELAGAMGARSVEDIVICRLGEFAIARNAGSRDENVWVLYRDRSLVSASAVTAKGEEPAHESHPVRLDV